MEPDRESTSINWPATVQRVLQTVVSIHYCQVHAFELESPGAYQATGFVVDADKGLILTNRHVVSLGPFWGYCMFHNHEECQVIACYRDPINDYGFLRFDPKAIRYTTIEALDLKPEDAKVGMDIRVLGNDACEKLSILSGVISRIDCNAPLSEDGYTDFNTSYIQAAASASGGSSGSPVVTVNGSAVALVADGKGGGAATNYFLPLDGPLRALKAIQNGESIARGTIQCKWLMKSFHICQRLGLSSQHEEKCRKAKPAETGMLVAETVLPGGPAAGKIKEGDILIEVNGRLVTQFTVLNEILDSHVGQKIDLLVQRCGNDVSQRLDVGDLHAITPRRFVTVAGGTFHDLSYQQAQQRGVAVQGVYVCRATSEWSYSGLQESIIQTIDKKATRDLDSFIEVMKAIPNQSRVMITYRKIKDLNKLERAVVSVDRRWNREMRQAVRNDNTGLWDYSDLAHSIPAVPLGPQNGKFVELESNLSPEAAGIVRGFVRVICSKPIPLDGEASGFTVGFGLVVDAKRGFVSISRSTVPSDLCNITILIAESIRVEGRIIFFHPLHNYTIVQYDPSRVGAVLKTARLSNKPMKEGQETQFFGFKDDGRPVATKTSVTNITAFSVDPDVNEPHYRAINIDSICVDARVVNWCSSGVLMSDTGMVEALWLTFRGPSGKELCFGLATCFVKPIIEKISAAQIANFRMLSVGAYVIPKDEASVMGVSDARVQAIASANPHRHEFFIISKVFCSLPVQDSQGLEEGDIVLKLKNKFISSISEFGTVFTDEYLDALVVRHGQEMNLRVLTVPCSDLITEQIVIFCGAVLQKPHLAVRQQFKELYSEVYVSAVSDGSPADQYDLLHTTFLTAINGTPSVTLSSFLSEVKKIPDNTYFSLDTVDYHNLHSVITMKKNLRYFPTMKYTKMGSGHWEVKSVETS